MENRRKKTEKANTTVFYIQYYVSRDQAYIVVLLLPGKIYLQLVYLVVLQNA